jgi:hypothetical protein
MMIPGTAFRSPGQPSAGLPPQPYERVAPSVLAEVIGRIYRAVRRENVPTVAGEKIRLPQDGSAGLRDYGNGGSKGGRDG